MSACLLRDGEIVAVHDAARPLVRDEQIRECLAAAREQTARVVNTGLVMMYW